MAKTAKPKAKAKPVASPPRAAGTFDMLRQQHVFRVGAAYCVAAWLVIQVIATIGPAFSLPDWVLRIAVVTAVAGFFATVAGVILIKRDTGRRSLLRWVTAATVVVGLLGGGTLVAWRIAGGTNVHKLAVLPFADLSPRRDQAYFAQGVAEEILSSLAGEKGLKVLGRTSTEQIGSRIELKDVRAKLGVTHLLEGSTRSAGDRLRVNVRLIDTADDSRLWEEEYEGRMADVFGVQDRIAKTVVARLRGTFAKAEARPTAETAVDAYQTYLAARALMRDPKAQTLAEARRLALSIVDKHPDYALGHALLADTTMLLADDPFSYGTIPPDRARGIALAEARTAIRLAPGRAEGYGALGLALPPAQAIAPYRKAISLDRSFVTYRNRLGIALNLLHRNDEAFEQYRLAAETDPLSSAAINRYVSALAASGATGRAFREVDLYLARGGSEAQAWRFRGNAFALTGDISKAIGARRRALALDPGLPYQHEWLALSYGLLGMAEQAVYYARPLSLYFRLFIGDDRGALKARVAADGAHAWSANGLNQAVFSLARGRDWPALVRLHDLRPPRQRDLCNSATAVPIAMALRQAGRGSESNRLLDCFGAGIGRRLGQRHRSPDDVAGEPEMWRASLLALRGDRRAFGWLDKAVDRGWVGQYFSASLADWPQFDGLRRDPRYAALQARLDRQIAQERAETLAGR